MLVRYRASARSGGGATMNCQICEQPATVHVTEIRMRLLRGAQRFHYHLCERHAGAQSDRSIKPISDEENRRLIREQLESSITDPAQLEQLKSAMPELWSPKMHDNQTLQRTGAASIISQIRKWFTRGPGR
jgi:hypothetical protein